MRLTKLALCVFTVLPAAALATPQVTTPQPIAPTTAAAPATKTSARDPNKMVCRTFDTTGSRLQKKRECRTNAQWQEMAALERREVEKNQANRFSSSNQ